MNFESNMDLQKIAKEINEESKIITASVKGDSLEYHRKSERGEAPLLAKLTHPRKGINQSPLVLEFYPRYGIDKSDEYRYAAIRTVRVFVSSPPLIEVWDSGIEHLTELPENFGTVPAFGLTFPKNSNVIVDIVEKHFTDVKVLDFAHQDDGITIDGEVMKMNMAVFKEIVSKNNRTKNRADRVSLDIQRVDTENLIKEYLGTGVGSKYPKRRIKEIELLQDLVAQKKGPLTKRERKTLSESLREVQANDPAGLTAALDEIEPAVIEQKLKEIVSTLETQIGSNGSRKKWKEKEWQNFFLENSFLLQLFHGTPSTLLTEGGEFIVKSARSNGKGEMKTDFIFKNPLTKELLILELKTPEATIITNRSYRGVGNSAVYGIDRELAGAVAQIQAQIAEVTERLGRRIEDDDPLYGAENIGPRGVIIVGNLEKLDSPKRKSFLRFRNGLSQVQIITYDEMLERLKDSLASLSSNSHKSKTSKN